MEQPHDSHLKAAYDILQYLKGTIGQDVLFHTSNLLTLSGDVDVDWASFVDTGRSVKGFRIFIGNYLVPGNLKRKLRFEIVC